MIVVTTNAGDHEPSGNLTGILFEALDHGVRSLDPSGSFHPFVLFEGDGPRELRRFNSGSSADSQAAAERGLASLAPDTWLYAWAVVGEFRDGEQSCPAVVAEAGERGGPVAFRVAQRFRLASEGGPPELVGESLVVGECPNRLGKHAVPGTSGGE